MRGWEVGASTPDAISSVTASVSVSVCMKKDGILIDIPGSPPRDPRRLPLACPHLYSVHPLYLTPNRRQSAPLHFKRRDSRASGFQQRKPLELPASGLPGETFRRECKRSHTETPACRIQQRTPFHRKPPQTDRYDGGMCGKKGLRPLAGNRADCIRILLTLHAVRKPHRFEPVFPVCGLKYIDS